MTWRDDAGIAVGRSLANFLAFQHHHLCTAFGQKVGATDANDTATDDDGIGFELPRGEWRGG
jgi:hypothetical protein